jgi:hypothetical protein
LNTHPKTTAALRRELELQERAAGRRKFPQFRVCEICGRRGGTLLRTLDQNYRHAGCHKDAATRGFFQNFRERVREVVAGLRK